MYGGGTQALFSRFPDGTLRFLPFDYIKKENLWFVELKANLPWTPISKELSIHESFHWPPHKILGRHPNFQKYCANCHGSQIYTTFDREKGKYDVVQKKTGSGAGQELADYLGNPDPPTGKTQL